MDKVDRLTPRQKPWVSQVRKAGDHLLELINEILDLARIESGKMTVSMENVDDYQSCRVLLALNLVSKILPSGNSHCSLTRVPCKYFFVCLGTAISEWK